MYANNPHDLEARKQNIHDAFAAISNMNCNKFPKIYLK
jgi:hypothetical protein